MTISKRRIALLLTLTMVFCLALFVGVASATVYNGQTTTDDYTISTASQMSQLASAVNGGTSYSGSTFTLTSNITLSGAWTAIGTAANPFSGDFNGANYSISGLSITPGSSYQGLFGYVKGGLLANVSVAGTISGSAAYDYIGGIVGYTDSGIANCHSSVAITINDESTATSACAIGGIAGAVENTNQNPVKVEYCSNSGNIYAGRRIGGIVGAVYCTNNGKVTIDQCYNTGNVTAKYSSKVYSGGIVGYCRGYVSNCYYTGTINSVNGGHYIGGVAGLLQGSSPQAAFANCYNIGTVANIGSGYCQALYATVDRSTTMPTENSFWLDTAAVGQDTGSGWGTHSNVSALTAATLQTAASTTYLNATGTVLPSNPGYYYNDTVTPLKNNGYPILKWQRDGVGTIAFSTMERGNNTARSGSDAAGAVYLDGTAISNGNGSQASPYNSFDSAKTAVESAGGNAYICVTGKVTISSGTPSWSLSVNNVKRSVNYDGYLVEVTGGTLTLGNITIDGNKTDNTYADSSLILVNGGTVTMGSGTTLQNNRANTGGGVRVENGTFTMNAGTITGNTTVTNSGGVMVKGGTFTMNGGTISTNTTSGNGGSVGVYAGAAFTMTGGTITSNTASGVGAGVYVKSDSSSSYGTFTVSPTAAITFGSNDVIYLCDYTKIAIGSSLSAYVSAGALKIQCANPANYLEVASGATSGEETRFAYNGGGWTFNYDSNTVYLLKE